MGIFSDILIDIEDLWSNGKSSDAIAEAINKQYGTAYTDVEVDAAIEQILDAQDQAYNDDMDGDFDSAMASAGFGTDEDYGYYGE
jgi:chloramphenicol 3-O-phosphotransferase